MSREYVEKRLRDIARESASNRDRSETRGVPRRMKAPKTAGTETPATRMSPPASKVDVEISSAPNIPSPPRMYVRGRFIYDFGALGHLESLTAQSPCGSFLDRVLGILSERPTYVHASDLGRHSALIRELRQFQVAEWSSGRMQDVPVEELPLQRKR